MLVTNNFNTLIDSFKSVQGTLSPQTLLSDLLNNYAELTYSKIFEVSQLLNLQIDKIATESTTSPGQYKLNLDNIQEIIDAINNLWSQGLLGDQAKNNLLSQIKSIQWQESPESVVLEIIKSGDEIEAQYINSLISRLPGAEEIINKYFAPGSDNKYRLVENNTIQGFVQELQTKLGLNFEKFILDLLEQQATDVLEILNSLSSQMTSGTTSTTEMKRVLDELNKGRNDASKLSYSDIYEYSEATHSFILTQAGIAAELTRLNSYLNSIKIHLKICSLLKNHVRILYMVQDSKQTLKLFLMLLVLWKSLKRHKQQQKRQENIILPRAEKVIHKLPLIYLNKL